MPEREITRREIAAIDEPDAHDRVAEYFRSYTGRRFERLAGGGDRREVRNHLTGDDLVAVSMLSVNVPAVAAIALLETNAGPIADLLQQIPCGVDLWQADAGVISASSPAAELWSLLRTVPGVGWVTTGKLLARKRPRLIPVYDGVVQQALGRGPRDGYWRPLRDVLQRELDVVPRLEEIRFAAAVGEDIALIRILDVVLWRWGKDGGAAARGGGR